MNDTSRTTCRTAYLGPEASFSHQAAVEALPNAVAIPLPSFQAILKAIQDSASNATDGFDCAVLPVENSTNGSVVQALDLLAQCGLDAASSPYPDVEVVEEHYLAVHHCLFVRRRWAEERLTEDELTALPLQIPATREGQINGGHADEAVGDRGARADVDAIFRKLDIKTLYTHPQVWGQCNNVLSTYLPPGNVDRVDMSSTSAAAGFVAGRSKDDQPADNSAAISSSLAGAKHGRDLVCIAQNIEDNPGANTTRFFILRNKRRHMGGRLTQREAASEAHIKSLFAFTIAHHQAGSLAATLAVFARHNFNLTAIQSRPRPKTMSGNRPTATMSGMTTPGLTWKYVFFVECFHVPTPAATSGEGVDAELRQLVEELETVTEQVKLLGSWSDRLS